MTSILRKLRRRFGDATGSGEPPSDEPPAGATEDSAPRSPLHPPGSVPPSVAAPLERGAEPREEVLERLRRRIASLDKRWKEGPPGGSSSTAERCRAVQEVLPGLLVDTPRGRVRVISETVARGAGHGRFTVGEFAEGAAGLAGLGLLYRLRASPHPERVVFLDTETTGLAGGAGTIPFLVGLAWLDGGDLQVEQLFLDHPRDEPAMVHRLAARLAAFEHVVTYNGRAFDVPLLQNRFVLHRTPFPPLETSLDLLPGARRLHRRHLDDRSLTSIERHVLGFHREDDVPGSEIPGIYQELLFAGRTSRMAGVIRHNRWDVVALAALLGLHARLAETSAAELGLDAAVDLALGELRYLAGSLERARADLERAAARAQPGGEAWVGAWTWLARLHRRCGRSEESAACWGRILARLPEHGPAHLGLAKYHEHRTRDLALAERHAAAAAAGGAEDEVSSGRRLARVRQKRVPAAIGQGRRQSSGGE